MMTQTSIGALLVSVMCVVPGCRSTVGVIDGALGGLGFERPERPERADVQQIIRDRLPDIARREMIRLNNVQDSTRIVFTPVPDDPLGAGKYSKEQRVYEKWYEGAVVSGRRARTSSTAISSTGRPESYTAVIEYRYRVYRTPEMASREDAAAEKATSADAEALFERYKYSFDRHGQWDGRAGRVTR